tara:strand:- start:15 stop:209 length:195 start_codon:yes stop_codon:yes gene_type:complete
MTYKLFKNLQGEIIGVTKTEWEKTDSETGNKTWLKIDIPIAEDNTDYQEYLAWVAEGNTPDPAD